MTYYPSNTDIEASIEEYGEGIPLSVHDEKRKLIISALKIAEACQSSKDHCKLILSLIGDQRFYELEAEENDQPNDDFCSTEGECIKLCSELVDTAYTGESWYWHLARFILNARDLNFTWKLLLFNPKRYFDRSQLNREDILEKLPPLILHIEPSLLEESPFVLEGIVFDKFHPLDNRSYEHLIKHRDNSVAKETIIRSLAAIVEFENKPEIRDSWLRQFIPKAINDYIRLHNDLQSREAGDEHLQPKLSPYQDFLLFCEPLKPLADLTVWSNPAKAFRMLADIDGCIEGNHVLLRAPDRAFKFNASSLWNSGEQGYVHLYLEVFLESDDFDPEVLALVLDKHPELKPLVMTRLTSDIPIKTKAQFLAGLDEIDAPDEVKDKCRSLELEILQYWHNLINCIHISDRELEVKVQKCCSHKRLFEIGKRNISHFETLIEFYPELLFSVTDTSSVTGFSGIVNKNSKLQKLLWDKKSLIPQVLGLKNADGYGRTTDLQMKLALLFMINPEITLPHVWDLLADEYRSNSYGPGELFSEFIEKWPSVELEDVYAFISRFPQAADMFDVYSKEGRPVSLISAVADNPSRLRDILKKHPSISRYLASVNAGVARKALEGQANLIVPVLQDEELPLLERINVLIAIGTAEAIDHAKEGMKCASDDELLFCLGSVISNFPDNSKQQILLDIIKSRVDLVDRLIASPFFGSKILSALAPSVAYHILMVIDPVNVRHLIESRNKGNSSTLQSDTQMSWMLDGLLCKALQHDLNSLEKVIVSVLKKFEHKLSLYSIVFKLGHSETKYQFLKRYLELYFDNVTHDGTPHVGRKEAIDALIILCSDFGDRGADDAERMWRHFETNQFPIIELKGLFDILIPCEISGSSTELLWLNRMATCIALKVEGWKELLLTWQMFALHPGKSYRVTEIKPLLVMTTDILLPIMHDEYQRMLDTPEQVLEDPYDTWIPYILILGAGMKIWRKASRQLLEAGIAEERIGELLHLPDKVYPHRINLEKVFKEAGIVSDEARGKMLDRCDDEVLPGLLRSSLKKVIDAKKLCFYTETNKDKGWTALTVFLNEVYRDYPKAWTRILVNIFQEYHSMDLHWFRGIAFALGKLREPMGGKVPKLLAKAAEDKTHPAKENGARNRVAEIQRSLFNRENFNKGHNRSPRRRVEGAIKSLIDAHKFSVQEKIL